MAGKKSDPKKPADKSGEAAFISTTFDFFSNVLKAIAADTFLSVLWGVEVLLFAILALMILFGNISPDQRFNLALVIIA